ncbi:ribonuclease E activity regulator RraA [Halalkalibacter hemicellulosilyticus]|uniref:4-hydroxy-4-methyl-2-oxoglutarate aldolase n=1 Tax=Halalkalibacter hemicellulosilyticusJCM 9152 TaxID=1236971 RepID=W4QF51_9BACI|nr:ribonuclease E activity regulator RraA [Halalkalibacter hemicellulosilyticus]GAE29944.1 ribonuclease E inhibitor RraA [Halalkalibacter hemicellulosilyticusJCM 9152]
MSFHTSQLCDQNDGQIVVAESSLLQYYGNKKAFSGRVVTVKVYEDYGLVKKVIETAEEGSVIVIHGSGSRRSALIGAELAQLSIEKKVSGLIIYGCIRDSEMIKQLDIGVMAIGTIPVLSSCEGSGETDIAFHFASVDWKPGQYVYVDQDGVVVSDEDLLQ